MSFIEGTLKQLHDSNDTDIQPTKNQLTFLSPYNLFSNLFHFHAKKGSRIKQ